MQRNPRHRLPIPVGAMVVVGMYAFLFYLERRRPLRRTVESTLERTERNLVMAGLAATALHMTERPITEWLTALVER